MKILVTGRSGQLARSLGERAGAHPTLDLVFVGRPDLDLAIPGSAAAIVRDVRPDVVINAAAYTAVDQAEGEPGLAFRTNANAAGEIAEASWAIGAPIVQLSTDYVFDGNSTIPYQEDDATGPLNIYGASKLAGEQKVRIANPEHAIIRTSWVVSPFARNFVKTMMDEARRRRELGVVIDQRARPTAAAELADAIFLILNRGAFGETFHVANAGEASWLDLAQVVMDECRSVGAPAAQILPIQTVDFGATAKRPQYSVLDCTKFQRATGVTLQDWHQSVRQIVRRLADVSP